MTSFNWSSFFLTQMFVIPELLVFIVGIILSIVFWKRHPGVSLLCLIAFLIFLGNLLLGSGMNYWIMNGRENGSPITDIAGVMGVVTLCRVTFGTIGWILFLTALFGWRPLPGSYEKVM